MLSMPIEKKGYEVMMTVESHVNSRETQAASSLRPAGLDPNQCYMDTYVDQGDDDY
jgi:hypothetical protein